MKFSTAIVALTAAAAVSALPGVETNGQRLARGLPPLPPARRGTPVAAARRSTPSSTNSCNTGPIQCCNSVVPASDPVAKLIIGLLGIVVSPTVIVGLTCSPLSVTGVGGSSCSQQPVCCENNSFNGLIAIGCSPINITL